MPLRRITVTHTERNDSGSTTSVEFIVDVDEVKGGQEVDPVAMIRRLTAAAIDGTAKDPPPPKTYDTPAPSESPHPARWESKAPTQPVEVKLGSNGWRINCPIHGDHAATHFGPRTASTPPVIKCTAKTDAGFCKVGAPPPKSAGGAL